jgi:hypothetical protein
MAASGGQKPDVNCGCAGHGNARPGHDHCGIPDAKDLRAALYGWAFHAANRSIIKLSGDQDRTATAFTPNRRGYARPFPSAKDLQDLLALASSY